MTHHLFVAIVGSALVTALIRILPILCLGHRSLPPLIKSWLTFIPPAILATIISNAVLQCDQKSLFGFSVGLWATLVCLVVGLIWKNLFAPIIASVIAYLIFQHIPYGF